MTCIVCGCTDTAACVDQDTGERCTWFEFEPGVTEINGGGLCTFCEESGYESKEDEEDLRENDLLILTEGLRMGYHKPTDAEEPLVELVSDAEANRFLRARKAGA